MVIRYHNQGREGLTLRIQAACVAVLICGVALMLRPKLVAAQSADASADDSPAAASSSTDEVAPPPADDSWNRVDSSEGDSEGQVLEVPQVVDPQDAASDTADGGDNDPSEGQAAAADDAGDGSDANGDQVGSLDDYQNQQAESAANGFY